MTWYTDLKDKFYKTMQKEVSAFLFFKQQIWCFQNTIALNVRCIYHKIFKATWFSEIK